MNGHRPECAARAEVVGTGSTTTGAKATRYVSGEPCICEQVKQAEKRLLSEVFLVLKDIPDDLWIAKNSDQAFNVKWYVIEKVDEIGGRP